METGTSSVIGTVLSGRYRLDAQLGSGGMSIVYLAYDHTLEREVAIKMLNAEVSEQPGQLDRFNREARDMAKLSHPNVVSVIDAGEDDGRRYIVFERVGGETLKRRISRLGRLPLDEAAAYAIEVGRGLGAAHSRKLVHRDVKPQNVLIDHEGRAKLTDFGIARTLGADSTTATGRALGTTDYVSPQQAMGEDVDERSDVYSLGIVLFEMLTGDVPFHADTMVAVAMKHVNEGLPDVQRIRPETSSALAAVVDRATQKDPRRRYRHMAEMLDDLEAALEVEVSRSGSTHGEVTSVLESVPPQQRLLKSPRASRAGAAMGALGIALLAAVLILTGGGPRSGGSALPLHAAHDFDPLGDGTEHAGTTGLAVDGNPSGTSWETERYSGEGLGKPGVGLYLDAQEPKRVKAVEIRTPTPGWSVEVRAAPGQDAPSDLAGWPVIGEASSVSSKQRINIASPGNYRYYMLWITSLPTGAGAGDSAVAVSDVQLLR